MSRSLIQAYLALAAICIIWGTTYTAIKYAVRDFPPYLLVGVRQTAAGALLLGWALASGRFRAAVFPPGMLGASAPERPLTRRYVWRQVLTGVCTITGGNGFITWGMQHVSSGLAAVIGSLTPVVVVLINLAWRGAERFNALMNELGIAQPPGATALTRDEAGFIVSAELVLIATIAVLSMVVGLSEIAINVNNELEDVGSAFGSINQSYCYRTPNGKKGNTTGSHFQDRGDDCDGQNDINCNSAPQAEAGHGW